MSATPATSLQVGTTYVFFLPPGWIWAGTVTAKGDGYVSMSDVVHLESCNQTHSMFGSVPNARNPKELQDAVKTSWGIRDNTIFREDAILVATPCQISMRSLARQDAANAIRGAA